MGFLSLYRKYRPHSFADLVGQEHIVRTLQNALKNDRIAHAYLFAGPRGTGKTSTAKVFAQALNCENGPTPEPCGQCDTCQKIQNGQSIDVIEIDAASNRGIDEIRDLREKVKFYPSEGSYKVYIIDEVHMLTKGAFNALLKTLEEPPDNVVFILATTEPHKVIDTIHSRCQRFDFSLLSLKDIMHRLKYICHEEDVEFEEVALQVIARSSNGGLRDAISLLDQAISYTNADLTVNDVQEMLGKVDEEQLNQFFTQIINYNSAQALERVNDLINRGYGTSIFVSDLIEHTRQLLLVKECGASSNLFDFTEEKMERLLQESQTISTDRLISIIEVLTGMERDLSYTDQPRLIIEIGIIKMASAEVDNSLLKLKARVEKLEKMLASGQISVESNSVENKKRNKPGVKQDNLDKSVGQDEDRGNEVKVSEENNSDKEEVTEETAAGAEETTADNPQSESVDIASVKKAWPVILEEIKQNNISVQAFLREGKPTKTEENTIYIYFPADKGFHKKGAHREENLIKNTISRLLGKPCQLEFVLEGESEQPAKKKDELKQPENNLVDKVVKLFDGEIIKVNQEILND